MTTRKQSLIIFLRCMSFMLLLSLVLYTLSYAFAPKNNTEKSGIINPNANGFLSEPKNSIDLMVIGNSDAYSGFSPMELWKNFGYTSYVCGEGRQVPSEAVDMLSKIIKCQSPKIVFLETDGFFTKTGISEFASGTVKRLLGSSFSIFQYHNRWKHLKSREMFRKPNYSAHCASKGQMLSNDIKGYFGGEYMIKSDRKTKISPASLPFIDDFINVCKENNITPVFLEIPSQSSWTYEKHNTVQALADEKGVEFIDMNLDRDRFELDWKTDTRDKGNHLNCAGARKVTLFLGKYLQEKFELTDHRTDKNFDKWNQDYEDYLVEAKI